MTPLESSRLASLASVLALVGLVTGPAHAQPRDPSRLFPHQAAISLGGDAGELHRLPLPADVLTRARPDLSDVRIHIASGQDVPFVIDSGARPWPEDATPPTFAVQPVRVDRRIERGESLASIWREVLDVAPPGRAPDGTRWRVTLTSARPRFVRTVVIRLIDGPDVVELARGSIYRFQDPLREQTTLALPELPATRTAAPMVQIELWGEGEYVEPQVYFTASREPPSPLTLALPLELAARRSQDGATRLELARPSGLRPDRIRVVTTEANFHRRVRVVDLAQGQAPREIGRGEIYRIRDLEGAELLTLDVGAAEGERLEIEVIDGDSPPLAGLGVEVVVRQPVLLFGAPYEPAMLRFGGGRALAPRYDLGALSHTWVGEQMRSRGTREASLGERGANPGFDDAPALGFAMRAGRVEDLARFTHEAPVTIAETREGLTRIRVPAALLAHARGDLADARVVDGEGRQWPYLRASDDAPELLVLTAARPLVSERRSTYALELPVARVEARRLRVHTDAPFVSRPVHVRGIGEEGRWVDLHQGTLQRDQHRTGPIELDLWGPRVSRIELRIEDGNDAPLEVSSIELEVPTPWLYVAAPAGTYRLLVGDVEAQAPRYEIEQARSLVMAVQAGEGVVGEARANPAHVAPAWHEAAELSTWIVWGVLLLAVLVLGAVTLRLARSAPEPEPALGAQAPSPAGSQAGSDEPPPSGPEGPPSGP